MKCSKYRQQLKKKTGLKTPYRCKCTGTFIGGGYCKKIGLYKERREEQMIYAHAATTIQRKWRKPRAVITIQSIFRMYLQRKLYLEILSLKPGGAGYLEAKEEFSSLVL